MGCDGLYDLRWMLLWDVYSLNNTYSNYGLPGSPLSECLYVLIRISYISDCYPIACSSAAAKSACASWGASPWGSTHGIRSSGAGSSFRRPQRRSCHATMFLMLRKYIHHPSVSYHTYDMNIYIYIYSAYIVHLKKSITHAEKQV